MRSGTEAGLVSPWDGALLGHLFESLVTLCVRVYAQAAEARVRHLRVQGSRREARARAKRCCAARTTPCRDPP